MALFHPEMLKEPAGLPKNLSWKEVNCPQGCLLLSIACVLKLGFR